MKNSINVYSVSGKNLGKRLYNLALAWSRDGIPARQADQVTAITNLKGRKRSVNGTRDVRKIRAMLEKTVAEIRRARQERYPWRQRIGSRPWGEEGMTAYWLEPISERLQRYTHELVAAADSFRFGAAGGARYSVRLTRDPREVGYHVRLGTNRNTYRGEFRGWAARTAHHEVTVPSDWLIRVYKRGLADLGGLLTLDGSRVKSPVYSIEVYAAVWASQGRGYAVKTHYGFIARSGEKHHHAATLEGAIRGVQRKARSQGGLPESLEADAPARSAA